MREATIPESQKKIESLLGKSVPIEVDFQQCVAASPSPQMRLQTIKLISENKSTWVLQPLLRALEDIVTDDEGEQCFQLLLLTLFR